MAHCKGLVLLLAACAALHVALAQSRCSSDTDGDLVGRDFPLAEVVIPAGSERTYVPIQKPPACNFVNGVTAEVCDEGGDSSITIDWFGSLHVDRYPWLDYDATLNIVIYCD